MQKTQVFLAVSFGDLLLNCVRKSFYLFIYIYIFLPFKGIFL